LIIKCPNCPAIYNVKNDKIKIGVTKLKCSKCEFLFVVSEQDILNSNSDSEKVSRMETNSEAAKPGVDEEEKWIAEARRLAEVIVSDIQLYNKDKISQCKTDEDLVLALSMELKKGREYYMEKVHPNIKYPNRYYAEAVRKFLKMKSREKSE